jgi:CHAT domain-containing protein
VHEKQAEPFIETAEGKRIPFVKPGEHSPDVAVLSACQTGLGEMRGAGEMLGFARSMFAAGGRAMVAALWQVDDERTRELMGELYMSLKATHNMSSALAAAQRKAIALKRHPYFWASFICNGDASFA